MQIKGIVTLIKRDAATGDVISEQTETNVITDWFHYGERFTSINVAISGQDVPSYPELTLLHETFEFGQAIAGVTSPEGVFNDTTPYYTEWRERFPAPTADRTIRVIALTQDGSILHPTTFKTIRPRAYLALTTPCTQTTTEIIDIFYRVQFLNPVGTGLNDRQMQTFAEYVSSVVIPPNRQFFPSHANYNWQANIDPVKYPYIWGSRFDELLGVNNRSFKARLGKHAYNVPNDVNSRVGTLVGTVYFDNDSNDSEESYFFENIKSPSQSPVQTIFPHGPTATTPFFDALTGAAGGGRVTIDGSSWTNPDFPELYRIEIGTTGTVGTSEYRFKKRNVLGVIANTYQDRIVSVPWVNERTHAYGTEEPNLPTPWGNVDIVNSTHLEQRYDDTTLLAIGLDVVARIDIINQNVDAWYVDSTPALPATEITQVESDPATGDIWVGCRQTGLYQISADGLTVTAHDATGFPGTPTLTNQCYGVDVGNGRIWAAFEGGIAYTADNGSTWVTYDDTTTPAIVNATVNANWSTIKSLRADPTSANHEIGLLYYDGNGPVLWWDPTTGSAVSTTGVSYVRTSTYFNVTGIDLLQRIKLFEVSDQGTWISKIDSSTGKPSVFTYGSTAKTDLTSPPFAVGNVQTQFTEDNLGNEAIILQNGYNMWLTTIAGDTSSTPYNFQIGYTGAGTQLISYHSNWGCHLGNGLFVSLVQGSDNLTIMYRSDLNDPLSDAFQRTLWTDYGWNGSAWVKDNPGSKQTHAGSEALINGLTISFDNNGDQFVANDYYTAGVVDGIWLDAATEFEFETAIFTRPVEDNVTDFEPAVLPASTSDVAISRTLTNSNLYPFLNGWIDIDNATASGTYNNTSAYYTSSGAQTLPGTYVTAARSADPLVGDFYIPFYNYKTSTHLGSIFGIVPATDVGTAIADSQITHGFWQDNDPNGTFEWYVRESATNVHTITQDYYFDFEDEDTLGIERVGSTINYYVRGALVHTSAAPSTGPVHLQILINAGSGVFFNQEYPSFFRPFKRSFNDYFTVMGNSTTMTGAFDPDFFTIDDNFENPPKINVLIDGVAPTTILLNDFDTILNAGEISFFPDNGVIRYSPSDAGKTITGSYRYVKRG